MQHNVVRRVTYNKTHRVWAFVMLSVKRKETVFIYLFSTFRTVGAWFEGTDDLKNDGFLGIWMEEAGYPPRG